MPVDLQEGTAQMLDAAAEVVADSVTEGGVRLTTMAVRMHRFVLAEFNTHRVFSRNSASSRAIPYPKQRARVLEAPAVPFSLPTEQRGMQGGEEIQGRDRRAVEEEWVAASRSAVDHADRLAGLRLHKSVVNRVVEPYMWHEVIVTSTAWENFFGLRLDRAAQPEIRGAAVAMEMAFKASTPTLVRPPLWHLPYIERQDIEAAESHLGPRASTQVVTALLVRASAARCARVSYLTHEGERDVVRDQDLYAKLTSADPMHASALEHPATPDPGNVRREVGSIMTVLGEPVHYDLTLPRFGNLLGWRQLRFEVEAQKAVASYA